MTSGRSPIPTRHLFEMSITATAAWIRTRLRKREIPSWKARIPLYPDEISTRRSEQTQAMRVIDQAGDTVSVNGESHSDGSTASGSARIPPHIRPWWLKQRQFPPSAANHTEGAETKESTTSALDSLAETAESVIQGDHKESDDHPRGG